MTSFGIEWDTNVLIYLPEQKLPDGVIAKSTAVEGDKWSISLEHILFNHIREEVPITEKDCMYSLEAQIGVFKNDKNKFVVQDIVRSIRNFRAMWNSLLLDGKITINNVPYPILTYKKTNSEIRTEKCYTDCARSQNGSIEYDEKAKEKKEKKYWSYVDIQGTTSIAGKVQITIGIPLKYVFNIFKKHRELVNKCNVPQNKNCTTITRRSRLINIETAYDDAYRQFLLVQPEIKPDTTHCEVLSFLMVFNYIIQTVNDVEGKHYSKAKFHIKPRTNLGIIYQNLDYEAGQLLEEIFEKIEDHPVKYITNYVKGKSKISIKSFFSNIRGNYGEYYMIEKNRNTPPTYRMNISPFGIYRIEDGFMSMIEENFTLTKVPYASVYKNGEPPEVGLREEGGITHFEISEEGSSICEWSTDTNGNILLEFRGIETLVSLLDETYRDLINTNVGKGIYNTREDKLELMIGKVVNSFFNPIVQTLDPTYIPVNSPRTIYDYPIHPPSPREGSRSRERSREPSPVRSRSGSPEL